jgi:hypothetical protein
LRRKPFLSISVVPVVYFSINVIKERFFIAQIFGAVNINDPIRHNLRQRNNDAKPKSYERHNWDFGFAAEIR